MKIGEVAKAAGVNIETVRYYEKFGLIPESPRTDSGYRNFPAEIVQDVQFIKRTQSLGFNLEEIKKLNSASRKPEFQTEDMYEFTMHKVREMEARIEELKNMKNLLEELAGKCPRSTGTKADCPIIQSLKGTALPVR